MPPAPQTLGGAGLTLLCLALGCWLVMAILLSTVVGQEVHGDAVMGQALAWFAAFGFAALAWLWIGGLLLKAGTEGMLPASGVALALYLAAGAAGAAALFLLSADAHRVWPVAIPALAPPLLAFYVVALYQPSMRPAVSGRAGSLAVWGAILLLSASPWPSLIGRSSGRRADRAAVNEVMRERKRGESLAKLQAMPADAPVWDWLDLLDESSGVRPDALAAVRRLDRRQKDVEDMLGWGVPRALRELPDLDLKATPRLCEAANAALRKDAKETRVRPRQDPREYAAGGYLEESLPAIRWLIANGCDCEETVAAVQASVETFVDTPDRRAALAALAALRRK